MCFQNNVCSADDQFVKHIPTVQPIKSGLAPCAGWNLPIVSFQRLKEGILFTSTDPTHTLYVINMMTSYIAAGGLHRADFQCMS